MTGKQTDAPREIAVKTFGWPEQEEFSRASGDVNPIHISKLAARRTQAGRPVVHGINAVLWGLDALAQQSLLSLPIAACKAQFRKLMYVGDSVSIWVIRTPAGRLHAELRVDNTTTATIVVTFEQHGSDVAKLAFEHRAPLAEESGEDQAQEWQLNELAGVAGMISIREEAAALYPDLRKKMGPRATAFLLQLSAVVGMRAPGLHSIFTSIQLRFSDTDASDDLTYRVEEVDDRFRLVTIQVSGAGIEGTVTAIARVPPVKQARMEEVARLIHPNEFRGSRALVVGGSRGLGELAAKMIAAGGGHVTITYALGEDDANAVRKEIRDWGGECETMRFDAMVPAADQLQSIPRPVTSLYYFATSPIFGRVDSIYSNAAFANFCRFYVDAYYEACLALKEPGVELCVLYPSSVAVVERPEGMTEYAMAKVAGEMLCDDMNRNLPDVRIVVARLPRLLTDQTATATPVDVENPTDVLLPLVRRVERSEDRVHEGIPVSTR